MNGRNLECRGTRADRGSVRFDQEWIASGVLRWCLPKGGSWAKSYDDVCPRAVREQSPAMMFAQGWIASKVLRWCLPKRGLQMKSCDDICPKVDRERSLAMMFAQGWIARWLRDNCATILNQDRQIRAKTDIMAVRGTAKGEECWWQQMGIVKRRFRLVVRLKVIEYYEGLFCYLSSYNLLVSDLWLDPDLMLRPLIQGWFVAFATHASHPMSSRNRNCYYYLLSTLFVRALAHLFNRALVRLFVHSFVRACVRLFVLTITSEMQAVQDVIHSLKNYALTSNHSSGPVCVNPLDHLE